MVNVRTRLPPEITLPKSVWSVTVGVILLSAIETALPCTLISWAAIMPEQETPLTTAPGATQFDTVPLNAKLLSVPL